VIVVVGDALLDRDLDGHAERLAPDAPVPVVEDIEARPRPGGAGLAAVLAARGAEDVTLVCALGEDAAGRELRALLERAGVTIHDLGLRGATPEKVRVRAGGRAVVRLDRGGGPAGSWPLDSDGAALLREADAVLVSDYGRDMAVEPGVRAALERRSAAVPTVWDPHPKGPPPVPGVTLATPNAREAGANHELAAAVRAGRALAARWRAVNVCVTRGAAGAVLVAGDGMPLAVPAPWVSGGDPCGAGDRFAATATARLAAGALPSEAVRAAVEDASAFVAAGGAAAALMPSAARPDDEAGRLVERVRGAGGTVVATGGCFDLLHAGHVRMLSAARALGDCLVVCLNSDASVARLKGPDRPLVGQDDRRAVLAGLRCVDAVTVFDDDDPRAVLRTLRPDVWVKGGDYAVGDLPEAATLAEWGGQAVIVPYVAGQSTTRLIDEARSVGDER
jgi:D-beta-D-heptose 7-phosphate kinase/D-beta-D-heptose 1-phosphate adenosyltransferase